MWPKGIVMMIALQTPLWKSDGTADRAVYHLALTWLAFLLVLVFLKSAL